MQQTQRRNAANPNSKGKYKYLPDDRATIKQMVGPEHPAPPRRLHHRDYSALERLSTSASSAHPPWCTRRYTGRACKARRTEGSASRGPYIYLRQKNFADAHGGGVLGHAPALVTHKNNHN